MLSCHEISRGVHKSVALNPLGDTSPTDNIAHVSLVIRKEEVNETIQNVRQQNEMQGNKWRTTGI